MNDNPLIFLLGGALILFLGVNGLRKRQVYLGRLFRFAGPKMVMKGRIPVLIYGIGLSVGGALAILSGITDLGSFDFAASDQIKLITVILLLASFLVSVVWEFYYYVNNEGPYAYSDVETQEDNGSYRSLYR